VVGVSHPFETEEDQDPEYGEEDSQERELAVVEEDLRYLVRLHSDINFIGEKKTGEDR
jgi:hypothetical protein